MRQLAERTEFEPAQLEGAESRHMAMTTRHTSWKSRRISRYHRLYPDKVLARRVSIVFQGYHGRPCGLGSHLSRDLVRHRNRQVLLALLGTKSCGAGDT